MIDLGTQPRLILLNLPEKPLGEPRQNNGQLHCLFGGMDTFTPAKEEKLEMMTDTLLNVRDWFKLSVKAHQKAYEEVDKTVGKLFGL